MLIKNEFPAIPIIEQIHITSMHSLFKFIMSVVLNFQVRRTISGNACIF